MSSQLNEETEISIEISNEIEENDTNVSSKENNDLDADTNIEDSNENTHTEVEDTNENTHTEVEDTNENSHTEVEDELITETNNVENVDNKTVERLTRLPISKIRNIMKFDEEVKAVSRDAIFLTTKATELFIEDFVKEVYQCTLASKKKTVSKRDVDAAIFNQDTFLFLDGALD